MYISMHIIIMQMRLCRNQWLAQKPKEAHTMPNQQIRFFLLYSKPNKHGNTKVLEKIRRCKNCIRTLHSGKQATCVLYADCEVESSDKLSFRTPILKFAKQAPSTLIFIILAHSSYVFRYCA